MLTGDHKNIRHHSLFVTVHQSLSVHQGIGVGCFFYLITSAYLPENMHCKVVFSPTRTVSGLFVEFIRTGALPMVVVSPENIRKVTCWVPTQHDSEKTNILDSHVTDYSPVVWCQISVKRCTVCQSLFYWDFQCSKFNVAAIGFWL